MLVYGDTEWDWGLIAEMENSRRDQMEVIWQEPEHPELTEEETEEMERNADLCAEWQEAQAAIHPLAR